MAEFLLEQLRQNRSFSGPFAYYSNTPMKIFAGDVASIPAPIVMDALARMQSGNATEKHAYAMAHTLSTGDEKVCDRNFKDCCSSLGAVRIDQVDASHMQACADTWSTCSKQ